MPDCSAREEVDMRKAFIILALPWLAVCPAGAENAPATASQDISSDTERFSLYNACRPMMLVVDPDEEVIAIGLTAKALGSGRRKPLARGAPSTRKIRRERATRCSM